jgi:flagellar L-ring protein precursor FlgH
MKYLAAAALMCVCTLVRADEPPASEASAPARPNGSLYNKAQKSLIQDFRAAGVGDVITVLVNESSSASSKAATNSQRKDKGSFGGLNSSFQALNRLIKPFDLSADMQFQGQGSTSRSDNLNTRLSAVVKQILPNGNLVIEASRTIGINAEKQKVILRGTIRPQDISPANTVSSVAIADATIQYDGKGPVGDRQRKGLLSQIFGFLF